MGVTTVMNVAAFVNESGELVDFYEKGEICLFEKISNRWVKRKTVPMSLNREAGIAQVRTNLAGAVSQLEDCEVFLMPELRGILRVYLEEMGYRVWKSEGSLTDQLENVALREQEMLTEVPDQIPSPLPVGSPEEGYYRIDLIDLLQSGVPHVSREVLMPFFETISFQRLDVVCDHVPRWFSMELMGLGLRIESQTPVLTGKGMIVTVIPKCGSRSCPPGKRSGNFSCHCGG